MTTQRIAGRVEFTANGRPYSARGDFVLDLGTPAREPVVDARGKVAGYKEVYRAPKATGTIIKTKNTNVTLDVLNMADATLVFIGGDDTKFMFSEAWHSGEGTYSMENGDIACEFSAKSATEIP